MRVTYAPNHHLHQPANEIFNGKKTIHQESSQRVDTILRAIKQSHGLVDTLQVVPENVLKAVHKVDYLEYLKSTQSLEHDHQYYPSVFPPRSFAQASSHQVGVRGWYCFDTYTPVHTQIYSVALESAAAAYSASVMVASGNESVAYALCRPPGHHAEPGQMGGYCYLNNAAIVAEYLSRKGSVVVLDVDFHHGNGTQAIFYQRSDVLTISIHADPVSVFPYFSGNSNEIGAGKGKGFNHNIPLRIGVDEAEYQVALQQAVALIVRFQPSYLVIALGLDTFINDPIGGFRLTTPYYQTMASHLRKLQIPTVIVQEGGYNTKALGDNVSSFLRGFESS